MPLCRVGTKHAAVTIETLSIFGGKPFETAGNGSDLGILGIYDPTPAKLRFSLESFALNCSPLVIFNTRNEYVF